MISTIIKNVNIWLSLYQLHLMTENKCNLFVMVIMITLSILIMIYDSNKDKINQSILD